ncbi:uncharacterized protein DC041_0006851 [Schistosoma bovis]|uniref:Translation initiation factor eIF-2B subunit alpha n=1 Tax=Schistosoma bovis TaxID=6184 RepID=A0A430QFE9_SCHBO|nr:uncharacterized protein DC041_0006851 [Schistosoma bovis]
MARLLGCCPKQKCILRQIDLTNSLSLMLVCQKAINNEDLSYLIVSVGHDYVDLRQFQEQYEQKDEQQTHLPVDQRAEAVVESGGILNMLGSSLIAMTASSFGRPVYVLAESFKFMRCYPLDQRHIPDEFKWSYDP